MHRWDTKLKKWVCQLTHEVVSHVWHREGRKGELNCCKHCDGPDYD